MMGIAKDVYFVAVMIANVKPEIPSDDREIALEQMDALAHHFENKWLSKILDQNREHRTSPAAFRNFLIKKARENPRRSSCPRATSPAPWKRPSSPTSAVSPSPSCWQNPVPFERFAKRNSS